MWPPCVRLCAAVCLRVQLCVYVCVSCVSFPSRISIFASLSMLTLVHSGLCGLFGSCLHSFRSLLLFGCLLASCLREEVLICFTHAKTRKQRSAYVSLVQRLVQLMHPGTRIRARFDVLGFDRSSQVFSRMSQSLSSTLRTRTRTTAHRRGAHTRRGPNAERCRLPARARAWLLAA